MARRVHSRAKRNAFILAGIVVVMAGFIGLAFVVNQGPRLVVEPETAEMIAKRAAPENGLNILLGPERQLPSAMPPEPLVGPDPDYPEMMSAYAPKPGSIGAHLNVRRPDDDPLTREYVGSLAPVLDRVIAANHAPYALWPPSRPFWHEFPEIQVLRNAASITMASAFGKALYDQDMNGALDAIKNIMELTYKLSNDGVIIHALTCYSIQTMGLSAVMKLAEQAPPDWLNQAELLLLELRARPRPLDEHLIQEWRTLQNSLFQQEIMKQLGADHLPSPFQYGGNIIIRFFGGRYMRLLAEHKDEFIRRARMSFSEYMAVAQTPVIVPGRFVSVPMIHPDMDYALSSMMYQRAELDTRYTGTALVMAIETYRRHQGAYPATLADLDRDWVGDSPLDAYGQPFAYHVEDLDYRLYSFGRDKVDDGGLVDSRRHRGGDIVIHGQPSPDEEEPDSVPAQPTTPQEVSEENQSATDITQPATPPAPAPGVSPSASAELQPAPPDTTRRRSSRGSRKD